MISAASFVDDEEFTVKLISPRPVADGGTAKIFLGRIELTDQVGEAHSTLVALKWFVNNMSECHQQIVNRELRAVRQVRHPYILPYLGTAVFAYNKILIAAYMSNGNLLQYLEKNPGLDRRPPIIQVATAVDFLHREHQLVHGDLKCENVLVADDGRIQLADFGLSTVIEKANDSTMTATALLLQVTVPFAAPELLLGPDPETAEKPGAGRPARRTTQTDVYAFGMLVVQAFTGRSPWAGCTALAIAKKLDQRETHPRPENRAPPLGLCDLWWNACLACWTYEPSARPTMSELLVKLDESTGRAVLVIDVPGEEHDAEANDGTIAGVQLEPVSILEPTSQTHMPVALPWNRLSTQLLIDRRIRPLGPYLGDGVFGIKDAYRIPLSRLRDHGGFHGAVDRLILATPASEPARSTCPGALAIFQRPPRVGFRIRRPGSNIRLDLAVETIRTIMFAFLPRPCRLVQPLIVGYNVAVSGPTVAHPPTRLRVRCLSFRGDPSSPFHAGSALGMSVLGNRNAPAQYGAHGTTRGGNIRDLASHASVGLSAATDSAAMSWLVGAGLVAAHAWSVGGAAGI